MRLGKATIVGGFVLGALVLAVIAILMFGGAHLFTKNLRAVVYFPDSIAGLSVGAPVTLRGVRVGTVRNMKIEVRLPDLLPLIPVFIEIEQGQMSWSRGSGRMDVGNLNDAVQAGLRAQLSTQSLVTGQLSVDLDFHPESPIVVVGSNEGLPEIPTIPSNLEKLKTQLADLNLPDLADTARQALVGILRIVGEVQGKIGPMADSLKLTSDAARVTLETTTMSVQRLQQDANQTLGKIDKVADASQLLISTTRVDVEKLLASANRTATQANKLVASLNDIVDPRAQIRSDLEATMRDLAASASSLRDFARELERSPGGALFKR
jgi:paraquat-inducible protein B